MKQNKLFTSNIYKMKLGDEISEKGEFLVRVPGGWIYTVLETSVFIPFNNEFQNEK